MSSNSIVKPPSILKSGKMNKGYFNGHVNRKERKDKKGRRRISVGSHFRKTIVVMREVSVPARYNKAGEVIGKAFTYMKPETKTIILTKSYHGN